MTRTDDPYDPFREARERSGTLDLEVGGIDFTMFLRHADLRRIATTTRRSRRPHRSGCRFHPSTTSDPPPNCRSSRIRRCTRRTGG